MISEFRGEYEFLSNFYKVPVTYMGLTFTSSEAAFQAAKCPARAAEFCDVSPRTAKRMGKRVPLRSDWEQVKLHVMYDVCKAKFEQNPDLKRKLLETAGMQLVEGNTWGDRFWGVCKGVGLNRLGFVLMALRISFETEYITAIRDGSLTLRRVDVQTPRICLEAVKQDPTALRFVKEQTIEICQEAVKRDISVIADVHEDLRPLLK